VKLVNVFRPLALLVAVGLVVFVACRQGQGGRCEIQSDCESPLVCNTATQTCENTSGGGLDAAVPDGHILLDGLIDSSGSGSGSAADDELFPLPSQAR
jgi:hypothetical protein